jgi:hypothetical protein
MRPPGPAHRPSSLPAVDRRGLALRSTGISERNMNLHWRHTHHYLSGDTVEVGDVPGHLLGAIKGAGLGFFDGGEVATHTIAILHDFTDGTGPHSFYVGYAFEDGSTLKLRCEGQSSGQGGGRIALADRFEFTGGSGRFEGAGGSGRYAGRRLVPAGGGAEIYLDFEGALAR